MHDRRVDVPADSSLQSGGRLQYEARLTADPMIESDQCPSSRRHRSLLSSHRRLHALFEAAAGFDVADVGKAVDAEYVAPEATTML